MSSNIAGIRVLVVGSGVMGRNHIRVLQRLPKAELVGIVEVDETQRNNAAIEFGCPCFQSIEEALPLRPEVAIIAVPTSQHFAETQRALLLGLNVLVEKPIAVTTQEADALIRLAKIQNRILSVGHTERFNPVIQYLRDALKEEEIISIAITRIGPLPPRIKDVGVVVDLAVHDVDIVRYLSRQEISELYSLTSKNLSIHEDFGTILMKLGSGAGASINVSWMSPFKKREIQIVTQNKIFHGDLLTRMVQEYSRHPLQDQCFIVREHVAPTREPLYEQLLAFLECIKNKTAPIVTAEDGREALKIALCAAQGGGIHRIIRQETRIIVDVDEESDTLDECSLEAEYGAHFYKSS